ncbi:hypothetical protein [Jejuia pallidilutea]|nr:hypothetical protein [Jejuia pallidilutea]
MIAHKRNIPAVDRDRGDIPYNDMSIVWKSPQQEIERNTNIND